MERLTPIYVAAQIRDVDEVRRLIRAGVDLDAIDERGMTPIHYASEHGRVPVVETLLKEAKVDVDKTDRSGWTALHLACFWNRLSTVQCLVATGGANVNAGSLLGETPLHIASFNGCTDIVSFLVEQRGANLNAQTTCGDTPLDRALNGREEALVRYILPRMPSITTRSLTLLLDDDDLLDIRGIGLEKYALGRGLENSFRRHPVHTLLLEFPLSSPKAFQDCIKVFPSSALSLFDEQDRLSIHVALSSQNDAVKSPAVIGLLFQREPRLALARDPTTGLYPHETAATQVSDDDENDDTRGDQRLDVIYKMFRFNPLRLMSDLVTLCDEEARRRVEGHTAQRRKVEP